MPNQLEDSVRTALERRGFTVLRNGWPDFMAIAKHSDPNRATGFALEVKSNGDDLSEEQVKMHEALRKFGVPVLVARQNFEAVIRKRGRALLTPKTYETLERQLANLRYEIERLTRQWHASMEDLALLQVIFEDSPGTDARSLIATMEHTARQEFLMNGGIPTDHARRCLPVTTGCLPEYEI
jgi:hypothetical protein